MFEGRGLKYRGSAVNNLQADLSFLAYLYYVYSCETAVSEMHISEVELKHTHASAVDGDRKGEHDVAAYPLIWKASPVTSPV